MKRSWKEYWAEVDRITKNPANRRSHYKRKVGGLYSALFIFLSMIPLYIFELFFGRSHLTYIFMGFLVFASTSAGNFIGNKRAQLKFKDDA